MIPVVYSKQFQEPRIRRSEILRYAGAKEASAELSALLEDALEEARSILTYKVCWQAFPIAATEAGLDLGFAKIQSAVLKNHLRHCTQAVIFGATVGLELDRLIARYGRTSPARALLLQAIGAERIEALCNAFQEEIRQDAAAQQLSAVSRFSPGYGDLPLELQRDIFHTLNCSSRIGLNLTESLIMTPSKSVTAIIGIGTCPSDCEDTGCQNCSKTDCIHRRTL